MKLTHLIPFSEHWATIYQPMLHEPKRNKRFYCVENGANLTNLAKELPHAKSPLLCIETNIGGGISDSFFMPEYSLYFFVQANPTLQNNDIADATAKDEAMSHAIAFLNYIRQKQEEHGNDHDFVLQGLDLDNVRFETFGPIFNRWFYVGISLFDLGRYSQCVNPDDYIEEEQP